MHVQGNSSNLRRCCEIEKKNGEWFVGRRPVSHPGCLGSIPRGSGGMGQHLQRIAAWFRGRTPLSEARGVGSTPRGAGLRRGESPHGFEAGHCFQKHEAWVRLPVGPAALAGSCSDAGLRHGESQHGLEAGHCFQKHEAWVRVPTAQDAWRGYHNCTLRELHERAVDST